jgi:hypothetical protein
VKEALEYPERYRSLQAEYTRSQQRLSSLQGWEPFVQRYSQDRELQSLVNDYFRGGGKGKQRAKGGDDDEFIDPEVTRLRQQLDNRLQAIERGLAEQTDHTLRSQYDRTLNQLESKAKDLGLPASFITDTFIPVATARGVFSPDHLPLLFDSLVMQKVQEHAKREGVQLGLQKGTNRRNTELPPSGGGTPSFGENLKPVTGKTLEGAFDQLMEDLREGRI